MSIFGMGLPEMAVIGAIAVVVFGPKKLPELGSSIGKALKGFKDEMQDSASDAAVPSTAETDAPVSESTAK